MLAGVACVHRLLELAAGCTETLRICTYVLRPAKRDGERLYALLWDLLRRAPARGVCCDLLVDGFRKPKWHAEANVSAARTLAVAGWRVRRPGRSEVQHAKLWLFDQRIAVLGSHNLTGAALVRSGEVSVELGEGRAVRAVLEYWSEQWRRAEPVPQGEEPRKRRVAKWRGRATG